MKNEINYVDTNGYWHQLFSRAFEKDTHYKLLVLPKKMQNYISRTVGNMSKSSL